MTTTQDTSLVPWDDDAPAASTPLALYAQPTPMELSPPRLKLLQGTSDEVSQGMGRPGQFHLESYGAFPDGVEVEAMAVRMERQLRIPDPDNPDDWAAASTPCFSPDGITGRGDPGGDCAACPMKEWSEDRSYRCGESLHFLLWVRLPMEDERIEGIPAEFVARSRGQILAAKEFTNWLSYMSKLAPNRVFRMKSREAQNREGKRYHSPVILPDVADEIYAPSVKDIIDTFAPSSS